MIQLPCPWCGPRNVSEFRYAGEGGQRPDVQTTTPVEWRRYLYMRRNPLGWTRENWYHGAGCRTYFSLERHTETNQARTPDSPADATSTSENAGDTR